VKLRGFRIELGEIESLLGQHPGVQETAVIAREDVPGSKRLVAYVVVNGTPAPTVPQLHEFLKQKLPEYMVPNAIVLLEALPLTPNGKVDRRALPAPDTARPELADAFVAARTPVEELLAQIWAKVLGVEKVGIHDNFFELGGHSLLATQVFSRLCDTFAVELPLRCLFESPTVALLAEHIEAVRRTELSSLSAPPLSRVDRSGQLPLSYAQARLWFLEQLEPGSSAYNIPGAVRLSGTLHVTALQNSLNEIIRRHEALRTTFALVSGEPIQVIAPASALMLSVVDLPFEQLVEALQPERSLSHQPLFQVMFALQNAPMPELELPGLTLSSLEIDNATATFDLTLSLSESEQGLMGSLEYNTDLFEADTITRMLGHFQTLLAGIVADPQQRLNDLPILTPAERLTLLGEWNHTGVDYPKDVCIHELFEAQVKRTPEAVAVVFADEQLTYSELNRRANCLAHHLRSLGVGPDVLVGICVQRSLEMVVGLLGILKAGGAYLPLDPAYPQQRLAFMLEDAQVPVLLTQQRLMAALPDHSAVVVLLDGDWSAISPPGMASLTAHNSEANPKSQVTPAHLAYAIYTSGSTGQPKGVLLAHQGLVNHCVAVAQHFGLQSSDRILQFSSISFDIAVEELFPSWIAGATVILRTEEMLASSRDFLLSIAQQRLTILDLPTAYWHQWVYELSLSNEPLPDTLRLVVVGGEKASPTTFSTWGQLAGVNRIRWLNTYGPTETTVTATVYEPETNPATQGITLELPIGRPITNTEIYLLDDQMQPVPVGVPGELYIGGAGLARGYLNRPELTAEKFIPNPFSQKTGARLYKTGDNARYCPMATSSISVALTSK